jgi:hypothetical protein
MEQAVVLYAFLRHSQGSKFTSIASALESSHPSQQLKLVAAAAMIPHIDKVCAAMCGG